MKPYGLIYKAKNILNGKIYIGMTKHSLNKRISEHLNCAKMGKIKTHFYSALNKYGENNFKWDVVCFSYSKENLCDNEKFWISFYDSTNQYCGYNMTFGGDGFSGTQEVKDKISKSLTGKKQSIETRKKRSESSKNRRHSQETKDKLKKIHTGMRHSKETIEKMKIDRKGRFISEETKKKISLAHKGKVLSNETRENMRIAWIKRKEKNGANN